MVYGMAWLAYGMAWRVYGMAYGMTWRAMSWYMVWPGRQGMVYDMAGVHGIVFGMALRAWHGISYGLAGMAWYFGMAWWE